MSGIRNSQLPLIRPARISDFPDLARLFHDAIHRIAGRDYTDEQCRAWSPKVLPSEHWQARTADLEVRVAQVSESLAGFIGFSPAGYIDLLFTHPAHARRGVARRLLLDAEAWLVERHVDAAWTNASLTARGFFLAMGYQVVRDQQVQCRGVTLRNCRMQKVLRRPT